MKKYSILLLFFIAILCGCTAENINVENTLTEENNDVSFDGLKDAGETPYIGNSVSCLNQNGILHNGDELVYRSSDGSLKCGDTIICGDMLPECINVLNDIIYFINAKDNKVYSVDFNGNNLNVFLDIDAILFIKTDKYSLFEDNKNKLYLITENSTQLISDKMVTWADIYGKYVIYCEFGNGCQVNAYDTENGTITKLLDYGFFPTVHKDILYYQEKDNGYICGLDLANGETSIIIEKWGQQFAFADDELYYTDSRGIHSAENSDIYIPDGNSEIQNLFDSGNKLFFTEHIKQTDELKIYRLDISSGERILVE